MQPKCPLSAAMVALPLERRSGMGLRLPLRCAAMPGVSPRGTPPALRLAAELGGRWSSDYQHRTLPRQRATPLRGQYIGGWLWRSLSSGRSAALSPCKWQSPAPMCSNSPVMRRPPSWLVSLVCGDGEVRAFHKNQPFLRQLPCKVGWVLESWRVNLRNSTRAIWQACLPIDAWS